MPLEPAVWVRGPPLLFFSLERLAMRLVLKSHTQMGPPNEVVVAPWLLILNKWTKGVVSCWSLMHKRLSFRCGGEYP